MRVLNGRMLLAGAFGLVCSTFVSTAVNAAPGGKDSGGNSGYVGWTDTAFTGAQLGTITINAACQTQFGSGARWATANETMSDAPELINANPLIAWVRGEFIGRDNGGRYQYRHGITSDVRLGCELNSNNGVVVSNQGRFSTAQCNDGVPRQVACYRP